MDLDRSGRCFPHHMIGPTNRTRAGYSKVTVHLHIGNEKSRTRAERPCALVKRRWPLHWQRINSATVKIPSAPSAPPTPTPTPTLPCIKRTKIEKPLLLANIAEGSDARKLLAT
ncbi:hypothetical protein T10_1263 [Trichinella papuae]|uniref:Uncharacterized protein n=1 Tax=Trichinella papuae TaxID=268474 RepID=A0A0V1MX19_9BILA|nr:hypothetical protein T10_1263 [Trichinella papuae]